MKGVNFGKNGTTKPFLKNCGLLSAIRPPKIDELIGSKIYNYNWHVENIFKDLEFWFQHLKGVHFGKNDTKRPFLENCGSLSAIKQPKVVKLMRSKIQNWNLFLGNIFQDLEFWFQQLMGVHFGKNGTKKAFWETFGLLISAIKQTKMVQLIRSTIQIEELYMGNIFQNFQFWFQHLNCVNFEINDKKGHVWQIVAC